MANINPDLKVIYHYSFRIYETETWSNKNHFKVEEKKVLGINKTYVVLDDYSYTTLKHTKAYSSDKDVGFNRESFWMCFNNYPFDNMISFNLYTDKKKNVKAMKKRIQKYINEKCKWLGSIDLSQIELTMQD